MPTSASLTIGQLLRDAAGQLNSVAGDTAMLEARLLAQHAWDVSAEDILRDHDRVVASQQAASFNALLQRRIRHEPISHILGHKFFWKDQFRVTADVLTPRADSEAMLEGLIRRYPNREQKLRILDLGTGSGCLLLSALREYSGATGVGVDLSPAALAVAQSNADALELAQRVQFIQGAWCKPLDKGDLFDIVLTNPPYIAREGIAQLMADVRAFEPHLALDGGEDGLDCYRALFAELVPHTHNTTTIMVEIGENQRSDVTEIAAASGFVCREIIHDLGGIARILVVELTKE
jgi:release factor glutamine methyltransferase